MSGECVTLSEAKIRELARSACLAVGASDATAESLIDATISAERFGRAEVGFFHFVDYLDGMSCGRIRGDARPQITFPLPAVVAVDANDGIAQLGFDLAYDEVVLRARQFGIALFTQKNSFTAGELGYFVRRLAKDGLVGLAATNGPPLLAASAGRRGVYCTNPLAVGAPSADPEGPIVIDQASSITSYVNVALAAAEGKAIPHGWATDAEGIPTTDAHKALSGALLPFGGYKGANVALMVELLSAGLSGAAWSLDTGDFRCGSDPTKAGLTVIAFSTGFLEHSFAQRTRDQIVRLSQLGVHIPGRREEQSNGDNRPPLQIRASVLAAIEAIAGARKS